MLNQLVYNQPITIWGNFTLLLITNENYETK
jgi:hypothetical protein